MADGRGGRLLTAVPDATATANDLERRLRACGSAERAAGEKAYLKSDLEHAGAALPDMRRLAKAFLAAHPALTHDELVAVVSALWARPLHECRMAAIILLELRPRLLATADLDLIESMIRASRTWAYVDNLAGSVAGSLIADDMAAAARLDAWATDPNFWIRRSALLALMEPLRRGAPFDRFAGYAETMLGEKEFFIRKAIGWVLRETSKRRPSEVYEWLLPRAARASGVTLREAVKYLEPQQRDAILRAAGRRPTS